MNPTFNRQSSQVGSAVLVVLAFILLLTILTVAFLTKALSERTISFASSNQTRTGVFAAGAIDTIVSDFQQEIAAGSTNTAVASGPTLYYPKYAPSMTPNRSWTTSATALTNCASLLKESKTGVSFYAAGTNYPNASTYPPADAAFTSPDSNAATSLASANGRSISAARWNEPLLLPRSDTGSATDYTPVSAYTVPDWILVAQDGTNPTAWSPSLTYARDGGTPTASRNPVVGRYAYNVYDEGGTLDMNVAGFPSAATATTTGVTQSHYRTTLASVDLTKLLNKAGGPNFFTQSQVDEIIGWRNYATLQASGELPSYAFSSSAAAAYFQTFLFNSSGMLQANNTTSTSGQSDRRFSSRQELIDFLLHGVATDTTDQADFANALQYLGTFSRDIDQPSLTPNSSRPRMKAGSASDPASSGANDAYSDDTNNLINVPFLSTVVTKSFTRADGSIAVVGEPLVKKRFDLNRLAWLTYAGPIANSSGTAYNTATGISTIVAALKADYGFTDAFLLQGTTANIKNYFGLSWGQDNYNKYDNGRSKWSYVHNGGGSGTGAIMELAAIAASGRDPDFFELLKAAIMAGSKGKTMTYIGGMSLLASTDPAKEQYWADVSLDCQVMQIGANIIDQSRLDAYPTEIIFNDPNSNNSAVTPSTPAEICGVENFPYLYRVRTGTMILRGPKSVVQDLETVTLTNPPQYTDTGVGLVMQVPEIWNPHDINAPLYNSYAGSSFYPTKFRLVADSADPPSVELQQAGNYIAYGAIAEDLNPHSGYFSTSAATGSSKVNGVSVAIPNFTTSRGGATFITNNFLGDPQKIQAPSNTNSNGLAILFNPETQGAVLYREPTLLCGYPAKSGAVFSAVPPGDWKTVLGPSGQPVVSTAGFVPDSTVTTYSGANFTQGRNPLYPQTGFTSYVGIPIGLYPLQWMYSSLIMDAGLVSFSISSGTTDHTYMTYRLQYQDPSGNWVTYDEKYMTMIGNYMQGNTGLLLDSTSAASNPQNLKGTPNGKPSLYQQSVCWISYPDPRTSRFGGLYPASGISSTTAFSSFAPPQLGHGTTTYPVNPDPANGVLTTDRPDSNSGYYMSTSRQATIYPYIAPGWGSTLRSGGNLGWGLLTQNTLFTMTSTTRFTGDAAAALTGNQTSYYSDPDGVVRRAMGGNVNASATSIVGLPMATATSASAQIGSAGAYQSYSRPYMLKRPYRSVAELGYAFSGTPWKNLDFFNSESGDSALLDVFSVGSTDNIGELVAGKINLNTLQVPVLATILGGAYYDETRPTTSYVGSSTSTESFDIANELVGGSTGKLGTTLTPLRNVQELVGRYVGASSPATPVDGTSSSYYSGFGTDLYNLYNPTGSGAEHSYYTNNIQRLREAAVRALAAVGTTRVWNLMIDVVAQTGRYPATAKNAANFMVEGERRYWVHVAIDRFTGKVLDQRIEEVRD